MTHICVGKHSSNGSENGLAPTWTITGILSIVPLETKINETLIEIQENAFEKMASILSRPQCVKKSFQLPRVFCDVNLHVYSLGLF